MRLDSEVIAIKERSSMLALAYGRLDVEDGALVLVDVNGVRTQIPVGGLACIMLEPGTTVTHAAIALAADCGTLLLWIGEGGVRLYSAGQPGGARADRLLYQARLALDPALRLKVVRAMYALRFGEEPPSRRSVEQLRGIEGARVREMYKQLAARYRLKWGRAATTRRTGTPPTRSIRRSALPITASTVSARQRCWLPVMRLPWASSTQENRSPLCTTLRICSSSRRSCPQPSARSAKSGLMWPARCACAAVTCFASRSF